VTSRVFFALWPDAAVRDALHGIAQDMHRACGGRVTPHANLHLTVVFLGSVEHAAIHRLEAIAAQQRIAPLELEFGATGYWRHNRIVWASPRAVPRPLRDLVSGLEQSLAEEGYELDRREYAPHITLIRDARPPAELPSLAFAWPVRDFALVESTRGARGQEYRVVARWALSGSPAR